ncbi:MAG TPA: Ig-like domain-containing protein [Candidatus Koribacter sp.]|jgi:hypothetical protein
MRISILGAMVCLLGTAAVASVTVSSPTNGSTVSTSVKISSSASSTHTIERSIVYIDTNEVYSVASSKVSTTLTVSAGTHRLVVQAKDSAGNVLSSDALSFTASSSGVPSNAKVYSDIHEMSGWESCDKCAGAAGDGHTATVEMTQFLSSPSLTGKASKFYLKGSTAYSNGLWWKQLGANNSVSNFQYELYFYLSNPSAAQALEFDVNQGLNGQKYIFGTECDVKNNHVWKIYDAKDHKWMLTSLACTTPTAYKWNHLTWEFQRASGKLKFVSITLNGKKTYINKSYYPESSSSKELNVAIQIDGDGQNTAYSEWADKVTLSAW